MTSISVHDSDGVKTVKDTSLKAEDSALKAKTKDFKIVLEDPRIQQDYGNTPADAVVQTFTYLQ